MGFGNRGSSAGAQSSHLFEMDDESCLYAKRMQMLGLENRVKVSKIDCWNDEMGSQDFDLVIKNPPWGRQKIGQIGLSNQ